jgi:aspartate oxidase
MQGRIEKVVAEHADKLYLDISRAKDEIFPKFPSIKKSHNEGTK